MRESWIAKVDENGRLVVPPELANEFGLQPGADVCLEKDGSQITIRRPVSHLAQVYVEATTCCNLACRTCMRNVWGEEQALMSEDTFERILTGLQSFHPLPKVFLGGYGEPLTHPRILSMIAGLKELGIFVELITNGVLLDKEMTLGLLRSGLDRLWVSLDGASPESYQDVRVNAQLEQVLGNLRRIRAIRPHVRRFAHVFELGIAFVAMKHNIHELPEVIRLGVRLGATRFSISNVLAHTPELNQKRLYQRTLRMRNDARSVLPVVNLPRMDVNSLTQVALAEIWRGNYRIQLAGQEVIRSLDICPFLEKGSMSVRWDGAVSPCLPLLHAHESYLDQNQRDAHLYSPGNLNERDLYALWHDPAYLDFRQRLQRFDFSPCTYCNGCELSQENLEDCRANQQPTCGGCLWAQGLIQCP